MHVVSFPTESKNLERTLLWAGVKGSTQTMTKAEHNRPIPKLFDNRPSALAAEVFCKTISLVIYIQNIPIIVSFLATKIKKFWLNPKPQAPHPWGIKY
jgi:hypothetical protein